MQSNALKVNNYASLQNIGVITYAIEKVMNRPDYLPGLIVVRGPVTERLSPRVMRRLNTAPIMCRQNRLGQRRRFFRQY